MEKQPAKLELILKLIITQKYVAAISEVICGIWVLTLIGKSSEAKSLHITNLFNLNTSNPLMNSSLESFSSASDTNLALIAIMLLAFSVLAFTEGYGLHLRRRWAEWLTVIATAMFIPYELYVVVSNATYMSVAVLIINILIVYYLAKHKELFTTKKEAQAHQK